ncbi:MAG: thiol-disulfide oxidoreductase DCC family protein [Bacteroidales bacterium]
MKENTSEVKDIVFFDGYCHLCSGSVSFILKYEKEPKLYFSSLQSDFAKKNIPEFISENKDPESVILYKAGEIYSHSDAALQISRYLRSPLKYLYFFRYVPRFMRDGIYKFIAKNRYRIFGKRAFLYYPESDYSHRFIK